MPHNFAVAELKLGVENIMHGTFRERKGVLCLPVRAAARIVRLNVAVRDLQVAARRAKHVPHRARAFVLQAKNFIGKINRGIVARNHACVIALGERGVEFLNELGVRVHLFLYSFRRARSRAAAASFKISVCCSGPSRKRGSLLNEEFTSSVFKHFFRQPCIHQCLNRDALFARRYFKLVT